MKNIAVLISCLFVLVFSSGCTVKLIDVNGLPLPTQTSTSNESDTTKISNTNTQNGSQNQAQNIGEFFQMFNGVVQSIESKKQAKRNSNQNLIASPNDELEAMLSKTKIAEVDKTKWLFVVGIEKYEFTDNISYAAKSAQMFANIVQKKLGIPKEQSYVLINNDATQAKIKTNLQKLLNRVKAGDEIYFYYNGHGVPAANKNFEPFMLASDSEPDFISDEMFFSLNNIYGNLSNSKASKVVAFVDSCFSGATDGKSVLKGVAATKMKPKIVDFDKSKMVVITAGKGYQYSNGYDKKAYRLFSYVAMKNILEANDTDVDINSVYKQVKSETYDLSLQEYGDLRAQEPTIEGNGKLLLK